MKVKNTYFRVENYFYTAKGTAPHLSACNVNVVFLKKQEINNKKRIQSSWNSIFSFRPKVFVGLPALKRLTDRPSTEWISK